MIGIIPVQHEVFWLSFSIFAFMIGGAVAILLYRLWRLLKAPHEASKQLAKAAVDIQELVRLQTESATLLHNAAGESRALCQRTIEGFLEVAEMKHDLVSRLSEVIARLSDISMVQHDLATCLQGMESEYDKMARVQNEISRDVSTFRMELVETGQSIKAMSKQSVDAERVQRELALVKDGVRKQVGSMDHACRSLAEKVVDPIAAPDRTSIDRVGPVDRVCDVHFGVFAPTAVRAAKRFVLNVFAFLDQQRAEAAERANPNGNVSAVGTAGPIAAQQGDEFMIFLTIGDCQVDPPFQRMRWVGEITNVSFEVLIPEATEAGPLCGRVHVQRTGVPILQFSFSLTVAERAQAPAMLRGEEKRIRSVFASYASEDRIQALIWKRVAQSLGVDVFVDVTDLRAGDDWEERIWREIPERDMLALFWSHPASKSEWVAKEWRCAMDSHGLDCIHPVPLVDPRDVPPPPALKGRFHFEDPLRIAIEYEKMRLSTICPHCAKAIRVNPISGSANA